VQITLGVGEKRGDPINAPATPTPKCFMLAQEIYRLNAEVNEHGKFAVTNQLGGREPSGREFLPVLGVRSGKLPRYSGN
jgi:hypothetical protein